MINTLSKEEILRYSRHLMIPEVGMSGQQKLKDASILCVGTGGLGSPLAMYLAAAGVGTLGIVDFDKVDFSNLQRQVLHQTKDVGRPKVVSAAEKLRGINPEIDVIEYNEILNSSNALKICGNYDIVADGTDNFPTRYLVNDACALLEKPNVYASIYRFEGQASVFYAKEGPCYRCLFHEPPPPGAVPSCAEAGVLGVLPGVMGTIQATEAIKLILGRGDSLIGRLLLFDALEMSWSEIKLKKDPNCPLCGEKQTIHELIDYEAFCGIPSSKGSSDAEEIDENSIITPRELKVILDNDERHPVIIDVREPVEWEICHLPEAILIPEKDLKNRIQEFRISENIVLYCRTGIRSARALRTLKKAGFTKVKNLSGGIHSWSDEIDPSIPKY
jgi:sulfur-carrier protein adenylyltransferase/sulfurtransferase